MNKKYFNVILIILFCVQQIFLPVIEYGKISSRIKEIFVDHSQVAYASEWIPEWTWFITKMSPVSWWLVLWQIVPYHIEYFKEIRTELGWLVWWWLEIVESFPGQIIRSTWIETMSIAPTTTQRLWHWPIYWATWLLTWPRISTNSWSVTQHILSWSLYITGTLSPCSYDIFACNPSLNDIDCNFWIDEWWAQWLTCSQTIPETNTVSCIMPWSSPYNGYPFCPINSSGHFSSVIHDYNAIVCSNPINSYGCYSSGSEYQICNVVYLSGENSTSTVCHEIDVADFALQKTIQWPINIFGPWDDVTFLITVHNQGAVSWWNITLVDYIPNGLVLNDNDWILSWSRAYTMLTTWLWLWQSLEIPITFTILNTFTWTIINYAEISNVMDTSNLLPLIDIDSIADDTNKNNGWEVRPRIEDDMINESWIWTWDEDDHDFAIVYSSVDPIDALCGAASGMVYYGQNILSGWVSTLCATGMVVNFTGANSLGIYSWTCEGFNGGNNSLCTASEERCGDWYVQAWSWEACDDWNTNNSDSCSTQCTPNNTWWWGGPSSIPNDSTPTPTSLCSIAWHVYKDGNENKSFVWTQDTQLWSITVNLMLNWVRIATTRTDSTNGYSFSQLNCNNSYTVTYDNSTSYIPHSSQYEYLNQESTVQSILIPQKSFLNKTLSEKNNFWLIEPKVICWDQKIEGSEQCESTSDCKQNNECKSCACVSKLPLIDVSDLLANKKSRESIIAQEAMIPQPTIIHKMWVNDKLYIEELKERFIFKKPSSSKVKIDTPYILQKDSIVLSNNKDAMEYLNRTILPAYPTYKKQSIIAIPSIWLHAPFVPFIKTAEAEKLFQWDHNWFVKATENIDAAVLINNVIEAHSSRLASWNTKNYFLPLALSNIGDQVSIYMYDEITDSHSWIPFIVTESDDNVDIYDKTVISRLYAPDKQDSLYLMTCWIVDTNKRIIKTLKPQWVNGVNAFWSLWSNVLPLDQNVLQAFIKTKEDVRNETQKNQILTILFDMKESETISVRIKQLSEYLLYLVASSQ
jgi:cysteine-rich repeat protein